MKSASHTELAAFAEMDQVNGLISSDLVIFDIKIGSPMGAFLSGFIPSTVLEPYNAAIPSGLIYLDGIPLAAG